MNKEAIKILKEFSFNLIDMQHNFFVEESIDNSEHIPVIIRIADTVHQYLVTKGVNAETSNKIKKELINYARELFIKEWMISLDGDEEPPDERDARSTFDKLI